MISHPEQPSGAPHPLTPTVISAPAGLHPWIKEVLRFTVTAAVAALAGGYFAYQKAITAPVPAQYVVVDMAAFARTMQRDLDPGRPSGQIAIKEMGELIKARFKHLTDAGVVILDASQVIAAPQQALLDPTTWLAQGPEPTSPPAKSTSQAIKDSHGLDTPAR